MRELIVRVLIENTVTSKGLLAEHGLSFYIRKDSQSFIFDSGQGLGLKNNIRQLGLNLRNVSSVILSHGHYDHTGGVGVLLEANPNLTFRGHLDLLNKKYKVQGNEFIEIGIPHEIKNQISENIIFNTETVEIEDCIFLSGELPYGIFKNQEGIFKIWNDEYVEDTFRDEQVLYIKTPQGLVVFSGCSHNSITLTLQHIKRITGEKIYAVMGGFHLNGLKDEEIIKIVREMEKLEVEFFGLCHCTGLKAFCLFKQKFKEKVFACPVGTEINLLTL
ncbi:MBL fold metallo-hydrolase [Candidatus Contubernalis alkaliaceticus]|uniref:MBL fold metallo-hydrolase n=1 Tax=Candidatus Contubernalis alkaliaceticus TaxID=338645 RepID=UPI001F4BFE84|nr:MBL fold metallo-hydrolase [Candidatus Contubernalis alkalaceticus]UNC92378.1 MBL fold metallo-hydrolase [Candidatus Contubernalis alkalaceticus]